MSIKKQYIPAPLASAVKNGYVTDTSEILDENKGKRQDEINRETDNEISRIKGGSTKSITDLSEDIANEAERASGVEAGLRESIDELGQIGLDPDNAISTDGDDFEGDTTAKRSKIPTIGAIIDGNPGVYDVSKRNPTGGPNSDGKFTLEYILTNADTLIPTSRRHGGMEICFVHSSDNKYHQFLYIGTATTGNPNPFLDIANWYCEYDADLKLDNKINILNHEVNGLKWSSGVISTTGEIQPNPNYSGFYSNIVSKDLSGDISITIPTGFRYILAFYQDGEFVSRESSWTNGDDNTHIITSSYDFAINITTIEQSSYTIDTMLSFIVFSPFSIKEQVSALVEDDKIALNCLLENEHFQWTEGGFINSSGSVSGAGSWKYIIANIEKAKEIVITAKFDGDQTYCFLDDNNGNHLKSWHHTELVNEKINLVDYPTAKTLKVSSRLNADSDVSISVERYLPKSQIYAEKELTFINGGLIDSNGRVMESLAWKYLITDVTNVLSVRITAQFDGDSAYCFLDDSNGNHILSWHNTSLNNVLVDLTQYPTAKTLKVCSRLSATSYVGINIFKFNYNTQLFEFEDWKKRLIECDTLKPNVHFSVDDVLYCFYNMVQNSVVSIYDNAFFAQLKNLHDTYGVKITLNCMLDFPVDNGFYLSDVPNTWANEFVAAKDWLKFAFHGRNTHDYNSSNTMAEDYQEFVSAVYTITGDYECIDRVTRTQSFQGNLINIQETSALEYGIIAYLAADDNRNTQYLGSEDSKRVFDRGRFIDDVNNVLFIKSQPRLDSNPYTTYIEPSLDKHPSQGKYIEIFAHEPTTTSAMSAELYSRIEDCVDWLMNQYGAESRFVMDILKP